MPKLPLRENTPSQAHVHMLTQRYKHTGMLIHINTLIHTLRRRCVDTSSTQRCTYIHRLIDIPEHVYIWTHSYTHLPGRLCTAIHAHILRGTDIARYLCTFKVVAVHTPTPWLLCTCRSTHTKTCRHIGTFMNFQRHIHTYYSEEGKQINLFFWFLAHHNGLNPLKLCAKNK